MKNMNTELSTGTRYKLTFESTWSKATHPTNFPSNPHFSGLIGLTHNSSFQLFTLNHAATAGIESMAETGSKTILTTEINEAIDENKGEVTISGGSIGLSPGKVDVTFSISQTHPYASIVSMLAPSPDWFVGTSNVLLFENNEWVETKTIELKLYDAGTDSGTKFTSENANTSPADKITLLSSSEADTDFQNGIHKDGKPIDTFIFTFTKVTN